MMTPEELYAAGNAASAQAMRARRAGDAAQTYRHRESAKALRALARYKLQPWGAGR